MTGTHTGKCRHTERSQLWLFLPFSQRGGGIDPRHTRMEEQIAHGEVDSLSKEQNASVSLSPDGTGTTPPPFFPPPPPTSFFSPLWSTMSWSNTAPNSSWIFCISLMWLATLFIAFMATAQERARWFRGRRGSARRRPRAAALTVQVVVLLAVRVGQGVELPQQQGVLQHPLDGLDQVRLQGGRVLLLGVTLV